MSLAEMEAACKASLDSSKDFGWDEKKASVTLVIPRGFKPPPGFPRGYLLQVKGDGTQLKSYPAQRLRAWIRKAVAA